MLSQELNDFQADNFEVVDIDDTATEVTSTTVSTPGGITCGNEAVYSAS
ncbi:hypothetical protein F4561_002596 [Lipingzhangella halophila]|uniref:Uncharacterized protein n=1 Tax=Lipingzhangella halophila TaxID=1783352 RepID=A0A7W7RGW7_9ACTN|nr:hypothetical protein [Lipingzhangella halophila]MBB4931776.1 hypothetical protein [Lipingzhangella halophila]